MAVVLVADDLDLVRMLAQRYLENLGHTVLLVADGAHAVAAYLEHRPDAVLLDLLMPGMDGIAALRAIRELDPKARVAMLTAEQDTKQVVGALRLGAVDYVLKPFKPERLAQAVDRLLGTRPSP